MIIQEKNLHLWNNSALLALSILTSANHVSSICVSQTQMELHVQIQMLNLPKPYNLGSAYWSLSAG